MAQQNYTVYIPDRTAPVYLPNTMTQEEVRASLVGMGYTAVETAELVVENGGQTLRFRRVAGGTKGL